MCKVSVCCKQQTGTFKISLKNLKNTLAILEKYYIITNFITNK